MDPYVQKGNTENRYKSGACIVFVLLFKKQQFACNIAVLACGTLKNHLFRTYFLCCTFAYSNS